MSERTQMRGFQASLPILTYHSLDNTASPISIAPALFHRQMQYLARHGWRSLALDQLLAGLTMGRWPRRTFALTFDDGFQNFLEHALPVLNECGFTAIVFVVSDWVGRTNAWLGQPRWVPRQSLMDWSDLSIIAASGMEVAAHTRSHPELTRLGGDQLWQEVVGCRSQIEARVAQPVRAFAYPYGLRSPEVEHMVANHYLAGFSTCLALAGPDSRKAALERLDTYYLRRPGIFRALGADWLTLYLALRRGLRSLRETAQRRRGERA